MTDRYISMAEARANLPGLVREVEGGGVVGITRWGTPVAVLVAVERYEELVRGRPALGAALDDFLETVDLGGDEFEGNEFDGLRDRESGRGPAW